MTDTPRSRMAIHFSSANDCWETPDDLFRIADAELGPFDLDVCALPHNAKVPNFYSPDDDGLAMPWTGTCWVNPPYGRQIKQWVEKAIQSADEGATVVLLVPSRFDSAWGQALLARASEVRMIAGRVTFVGATEPAPFGSAIVVLRPRPASGEWASGDPAVTYTLPTRHAPGVTWTTMRVEGTGR